MIVFADVDTAVLASNAFEGDALSVRLGELYPDPPLVRGIAVITPAEIVGVPRTAD